MNINLHNLDKVSNAKPASIETMELQGYELIQELFVDNSGFGQDDEAALTPTQFYQALKNLIKQHGTLTVKVTGMQIFQAYIGTFKKVHKPLTKKIANNTLLVTYPDGTRAIRLHDTNIITEDDYGRLILDNGGWSTPTTHNRMNRYTSNNISIHGHRGVTIVTINNKEFELDDTKLVIKGELQNVN